MIHSRRDNWKRLGNALGTVASILAMCAMPGARPEANAADAPAPSKPLDFNRDIRPILSESCFACHGPDNAKRKGGLRLDKKESAFAAAKSGAKAIVAGKPDESELVARIASTDPLEQMPPPDSGRTLTKKQVETLTQWVKEGADWKGHWAYIKPARPAVPEVAADGFIQNDIDKFVLATLLEKGLKPSPEADRATLIRRLSLDLNGLPPTPAEVDAFVNDKAPNAYEALVDRLLQAPQFGERMAGHWLDLTRYADTTGYHGDNHRDITLFRDYVINAFNQNKPFNQFTIEQLAGDLLPNPTDTQKIASGYNHLLMTTQEGGAQAREYLAKYAADRVRNASTVWMGATLGCAECHDHKYDPFTTQDFYKFASFFADLKEIAVGAQEQVKIPTTEQAAKLKTIEAEIAKLQSVLDTTTPELAKEQAEWEAGSASKTPEWTTLKPLSAKSEGGATLTIQDDGSILASGNNPDKDTYVVTLKNGRKSLSGFRIEVMPDGSLPNLGPGRASNGNFVLSEFTVTAKDKPVDWNQVTGTFAQPAYPVANLADGKLDTGWAVQGETGRVNHAVLETKSDLGCDCEFCAEIEMTVKMVFNHPDHHALGRFKISGTNAPRPVTANGLPAPIRAILETKADARADAQKQELAAFHRSISPSLQPTRDALALARKAKTDLEASMPATIISQATAPRMMRVLPRGNWLDDTGAEVVPAIPGFLAQESKPASDKRLTRLDLAEWIVSKDNPLTARVFANRIWALAFGQGIVSTPDDLGSQGTWPTHPDLLDYLAGSFVDSGWDVKALIRMIVTSGTYRQSSIASEPLRQADPYNHWLARQGRFRIDAELIRDQALAVSGLLVRKVGGPNGRPYQPAGYWSHLNFPKREYQPDHGDGLYRRGLYTYWCRTFLHPSLLAFDAPTREECTVKRNRSNTPVQALVLLNDPIYVEAARALAERALREAGKDNGERIDWVYRTVLARSPRPAERDVLIPLYEKHKAEYQADHNAAAALLQTGEKPVANDIDTVELAAWTSIARVILNLHETITRN